MLKKLENRGRGKFAKVHWFDAPCCCGKEATLRGDAVGGLVGGHGCWSFREEARAPSSGVFHEPFSWREARGFRGERKINQMALD